MKVVLITQGLSPVVKPIHYSEHFLTGVVECAPREKRAVATGRFKQYLGSAIRKVRIGFLEKFCRAHKLPYFFLAKGDIPLLADWIRDLKPDIIVIYSMSFLLPKEIYESPRFGAINIHPSKLPNYRGPNPDFWHYYDMLPYAGVTIHYIDEGEDTGDILLQGDVDIQFGMKIQERTDQLIGKLGVSLLMKALEGLATGEMVGHEQPAEITTNRARNLTPEEHKTMIRWTEWPIDRIWHVLRGTESWLNVLPPPDGFFTASRWVIGDYEKIDGFGAEPGNICLEHGQYYVGLRDGKIFLKKRYDLLKTARELVQ